MTFNAHQRGADEGLGHRLALDDLARPGRSGSLAKQAPLHRAAQQRPAAAQRNIGKDKVGDRFSAGRRGAGG